MSEEKQEALEYKLDCYITNLRNTIEEAHNGYIDNEITKATEYVDINMGFIAETIASLDENEELSKRKQYYVRHKKQIDEMLQGLDKLEQEIIREVPSYTITGQKTANESLEFIKNVNSVAHSEIRNLSLDMVEDIEEPIDIDSITKGYIDSMKERIEEVVQDEVVTDDKTTEFQKKMTSPKPHRNAQRASAQNNAINYLIASQDLQVCQFVQGNPTKEQLNQFIVQTGIDKARVFKVQELKTKKKVVQREVTELC